MYAARRQAFRIISALAVPSYGWLHPKAGAATSLAGIRSAMCSSVLGRGTARQNITFRMYKRGQQFDRRAAYSSPGKDETISRASNLTLVGGAALQGGRSLLLK
jgi:hypothetical protein